jgi:DNA-binding PadR family transcriptional regulator
MVSLRYFVLGLLAQQSMSGYDIKGFLKGLSWLIGSPSGGSLYPVLRALRREGMVTMEVIPGLDRPPRKIYTIAERGRCDLRLWIEQPAEPNASLKAFVMRLLLASNFSDAALVAHLEQRRAQVAAHCHALNQAVAMPQTRDDLCQFLAIDYGVAMATAEQRWLDQTLDKFSGRLPSQEDP